ncbi:MAG: hypothetical protein ACRDF4_02375, partial [Rhabdochlamydiaceae bacterium]
MVTRIFTYSLIGAFLVAGGAQVVPASIAIIAIALTAASIGVEYWNDHSKTFAEAPEASAILEAVAICLMLGALHTAASLGFVAGCPFLIRSQKLRDSAIRDAITLGVIVLLSGWSEKSGLIPSTLAIIQAISTALIVWFSVQSKPTSPAQPISNADGNPEVSNSFLTQDEALRFFEVREKYRKLRDNYNELERRHRTDRAKAMILDWRVAETKSIRKLASTLQLGLNAQGLAIYGVPDSKRGLKCLAAAGIAPLPSTALEVPFQVPPIVIREQAERALASITGAESRAFTSSLLIHRGT